MWVNAFAPPAQQHAVDRNDKSQESRPRLACPRTGDLTGRIMQDIVRTHREALAENFSALGRRRGTVLA
jgi:hypothetical protein